MKKIIVYTTQVCPYCIKAKLLLDSLNLEYEEIDVTKNHSKRQEIIDKYHWMTVPAIFFDNELIGGFDELSTLHHKDELLEKLM